MQNEFDVIVIGAGPAAFSAATFLARANVKTMVIGDSAQSGLMDAAEVWNYPGFPKGISGRELLESMCEQAVSQGATFLSGEVTHVEQTHQPAGTSTSVFVVRTATREEFRAPRILLAHGANFIKTNLPGEKELVGKSVHYCALCDGPLYKGREVIVLGSGNLAAEEALQLCAMGVTVRKILTQSHTAHISKQYQEALAKQGIVVEVGRVDKLDSGTVFFIALGVASSSTFAQKLGLEMNGNFLKADDYGRTTVEGVWVAGLARGGVNQVAKSVGEGSVAAVDIIKAVKDLPQYLDHT
jgi:thioredoxin reductase (NADPH)